MLKKTFSHLKLPALLLFFIGLGTSVAQVPEQSLAGQTGTLEKMLVASGDVTLDLDWNRVQGIGGESKLDAFRFAVDSNSFFTVLVFDQVLRGPQPSTMSLLWGNSATLPEPLNSSANRLMIEKTASDNSFDLVVRDGRTGSVFFNIQGNQYEYDAETHSLNFSGGKLLISAELAGQLGRPEDVGAVVGSISINTTLVPIEVTTVVNGAPQSAMLPSRGDGNPNDPTAVPGPDVIVGDLPAMEQFGNSGTQVGLAIGTTSCNNGTVDLNWFALPEVDHPVIPQNLYRLSGKFGITTFEQIGQSWLKHAFTALTENACGFGCNGIGGPHLGVGCSDPYTATLNGGQNRLGSRAWVHPFTGAYPSTASNHSGHNHGETTHRLLVNISDLTLPLATFYAEAQYVTPHEYAWCQSHPGQCNMYNNASYRQFTVSGTTNFTFSPVGSTVRMAPAITAWSGATIHAIEPAPGVDGRAFIAYKVVPGILAGTWQYEYAIMNQNLDRGIQSFMVPLGCGITLTNVGFHAPPNHPGIANDGTLNNAGFSNAAWAVNQNVNFVNWSSETFAQNQNANAVRWGTLYNFRFTANRPPQNMYGIVGFYKTGTPIAVPIQGPTATACNSAPGSRR